MKQLHALDHIVASANAPLPHLWELFGFATIIGGILAGMLIQVYYEYKSLPQEND